MQLLCGIGEYGSVGQLTSECMLRESFVWANKAALVCVKGFDIQHVQPLCGIGEYGSVGQLTSECILRESFVWSDKAALARNG